MYIAAQNGHSEAIDELLKLGAEVNVGLQNKQTPLMVALIALKNSEVEQQLKVMQQLINAKANVNTQRNDGDTALSIAVTEGKLKAVKILLANGADAKIQVRGTSMISFAAEEGYADIIRELAAAGADMHGYNSQGATPSYMAAYFGHADALRVLHELGADISKINAQMAEIPLYAAARKGFLRTVEVILELKTVGLETLDHAIRMATQYPKVLKALRKYKKDTYAEQLSSMTILPVEASVTSLPSEKKEKTKNKNSIPKYEVVDLRKIFLDTVCHYQTMLTLMKKELEGFKTKSAVLKFEIFNKIEETVATLSKTLEGGKNNERLSHVSSHLKTLNETIDLHNKLQNDTVILPTIDNFSMVCEFLQNQRVLEENKISAEMLEKCIKIKEALKGQVTELKNETLSHSLEELKQIFKEILEQYKEISKHFQDLKKLNENLDARVTTIKSFRVLREDVIPSKRSLRNKKPPLSAGESKKIEEDLKLINETLGLKIHVSKVEPAPESQLKSPTSSKSDYLSEYKHSPTPAAMTVLPTPTISSESPKPQIKIKKLPLEERKRLLKLFAEEAAQKHQQKLNQEKIIQEALKKEALGIKREIKTSQESPKHSEHSVALRLQLEQLDSIVKHLKVSRPTETLSISKSFFGLYGSLCKVNELIYLEHKDSAIRRVARCVRNAIYKRYEILLEQSDQRFEALLKMAESWHTFIQKIEIGYFTNAAAVVKAVPSDFFAKVYDLGEALYQKENNPPAELEILSCVQAIEYMTCYWKMRKEELKCISEEEILNLAADKFCWGIIGSVMRKLQKAVSAGIEDSIEAFSYTLNLLVPNCLSEPNLSLKILAKALIEKGNAFRHEWAILKNNSELPYILMNPSISESSEQTLSDKISDYLLNIETEISNNREQKSEMDVSKEAAPKPFQISTFSFPPSLCFCS